MQFLEMSLVEKGIRTLMAMICQFLYPLINNLYSLFINISKVDVLSNGQLKPIYQRVTLILTIIMVFYVTFECVKFIVQPEKITDKEKGMSNIVYKMVLVVVLIAFVPGIFEGAYKIQNAIIEKNVIGKVILGTNTNVEISKLGATFSSSLLSIGYTIDDDKIDADCGELKCGTLVSMNLSTLAKTNKLPYLTMGLDSTVDEKAPTANQDKVEVAAINFEFNGFLSVLIGIIIAYILVIYCVDVGVRWAQLIYLQIVAPIPIIGYLSPKKDGIFQKWTKQCITTYLDLFIRTAIIYLVLLISSLLLDAYHNPSENNLLSKVDPNLRTWVFIFLVIGVMMFAKKAPKLLGELLPKMGTASGNFGFALKDRPAVARAAGATIGAGLVGAKGLISSSVNQAKRNWRNLKTGRMRETNAAYRESSKNLREARRQYGMQRFSRDKTEREEAKTKIRDAKIDKQSAFAEKQNAKFRFGSVAGVTGAVGGAVRGAVSGIQATDEKGIKKQVAQGWKNETAALNKTEKWYNEGGYSHVDRMKSSIEKSLGISTAADAIANEIKTEDAKIKENETLIAAEGDVKKKSDDVEGRIDSKLNSDSKATVDANAEAYLRANVPGIDLNSGEKMAELRKRYKAKTETAQAALDEAVKQSGGRTDTAEVKKAQQELSKARAAEDLVKKHTMRAAYTQVLQGDNSDVVAVQKVALMKQSINNARRNSETVRRMKAEVDEGRLNQADFEAFMTGNITTYDQFDAINSKLQGFINERNIEIARRKETKRKLETSARNSAAKANNSSSGK